MTDGRPEAPQAASSTTKPSQATSATAKPPSREHRQSPKPRALPSSLPPSPISTASTQNVKRSAHRTNTSNEGDTPAPTGPFDYPITLKTTLL